MTDGRLGILGGMGPLASAHFMARLTELTIANSDQDHIPLVLWSDPRIPDRTEAILNGGVDPLPMLLSGIKELRDVGCTAIAVPCNTAHYWYSEMQSQGVKILHIVEAVANMINKMRFPGPFGILATKGTLATRLYQEALDRQERHYIVPTMEEMDSMVGPAIAFIKAGKIEEATPVLKEVARRLRERGARTLILGCTDIPLAFRSQSNSGDNFLVVDSLDALADSTLTWWLGAR